MTTAKVVKAGFMPLIDGAPLIVASRLGFAEAEGVAIELVRETSWATLRDRLAVRRLDVAHMLAPMAVADALGLTPLPVGLVVPMALGYGGNTLTVSNQLALELAADGGAEGKDAGASARALARCVARRHDEGMPPLTLAIVHAHSAHHYQLAYWLGFAGLRPAIDVELVVIPPPLMSAALDASRIDGFCAGEPWGSVAVAAGVGHVLTTSADIWQQSPEKVLGVRRMFAEEDPERLGGIVRAVYRAAYWCDDPANADALARLLAQPDLLGISQRLVAASLARRWPTGSGEPESQPAFLTFAERAATFPWTSHAAWFYAQMVRWGQVAFSDAGVKAAVAVYRPDLYRQVLEHAGVAMPQSNGRIEGALDRATVVASTGDLTLGPDLFFDKRTFDPDRIVETIAGFEVRAR